MEVTGNDRTSGGAPVSMLELRELSFTYPDQGFALSVPELVLQAGETIALLGPSGSGKTTLLNLLAGILTPLTGNILLNGENLSALTDGQRRQHRLRHMGMIFQSFELLDYLDVRDNILLQGRLCHSQRTDKNLEQQARQIAEDLGLGDKWRRNSKALSQGERQRVAVCRALLLNPGLVLADEPTGNLDPENKIAVLKKLIANCKQHQRILLTVTHDHSLLAEFDRVLDIASLMNNEGRRDE
jgi:putative ABC transport system ATP-binding protein